MNHQRRKSLNNVIQALLAATGDLSTISYEEQCAMENIPPNLQESDRYTEMDELVDTLNDCIGDLEVVISNLEECAG